MSLSNTDTVSNNNNKYTKLPKLLSDLKLKSRLRSKNYQAQKYPKKWTRNTWCNKADASRSLKGIGEEFIWPGISTDICQLVPRGINLHLTTRTGCTTAGRVNNLHHRSGISVLGLGFLSSTKWYPCFFKNLDWRIREELFRGSFLETFKERRLLEQEA